MQIKEETCRSIEISKTYLTTFIMKPVFISSNLSFNLKTNLNMINDKRHANNSLVLLQNKQQRVDL